MLVIVDTNGKLASEVVGASGTSSQFAAGIADAPVVHFKGTQA
jgi:hypothetical protein